MNDEGKDGRLAEDYEVKIEEEADKSTISESQQLSPLEPPPSSLPSPSISSPSTPSPRPKPRLVAFNILTGGSTTTTSGRTNTTDTAATSGSKSSAVTSETTTTMDSPTVDYNAAIPSPTSATSGVPISPTTIPRSTFRDRLRRLGTPKALRKEDKRRSIE